MIEIISTNNEEVDRQLGGGIPSPSLILIEGDHGTGKSAISAQIMKGFLKARKYVAFFTENTVSDFIEKMKSITLNFSHPFLQGRLSILPLHIKGAKWSKKQSQLLLPVITEHISTNSKKCRCVIIDSLSLLTFYSDEDALLNFFTNCKLLVSNGMTIILTIHPGDIPEVLAKRMIASCDGYLKLGSAMVGDKEVKTMKIVKLIGAKSQPESGFAFDVDMVFGIKIVPVSMANA